MINTIIAIIIMAIVAVGCTLLGCVLSAAILVSLYERHAEVVTEKILNKIMEDYRVRNILDSFLN